MAARKRLSKEELEAVNAKAKARMLTGHAVPPRGRKIDQPSGKPVTGKPFTGTPMPTVTVRPEERMPLPKWAEEHNRRNAGPKLNTQQGNPRAGAQYTTTTNKRGQTVHRYAAGPGGLPREDVVVKPKATNPNAGLVQRGKGEWVRPYSKKELGEAGPKQRAWMRRTQPRSSMASLAQQMTQARKLSEAQLAKRKRRG